MKLAGEQPAPVVTANAPGGRPFTVQTIKEEPPMGSGNQQAPSHPLKQQSKIPESNRPAMRAVSVGRHPSGGQHANTIANTSSGGVPPPVGPGTALGPSSSNINPTLVRNRSTTADLNKQPNLSTEFLSWSAKYFTKVKLRRVSTCRVSNNQIYKIVPF